MMVVAIAVAAWHHMDIETRIEMSKWFWLFMVMGATAGIGWQAARDWSVPAFPVIQYDSPV